ncbi:MAG: LysR family transcriptional regulator [Rhodobacteraceae bacterium]|nr:LysR family transcriptional regulator [Paracoccaceae bacterium]
MASLKLRLTLPDGSWLGPGKADLLAFIAETGSISAAGRHMGMSYKRAWGLVEVLNRMFPDPLIETSRGGAGHGGAALTTMGTEVLGLYRSLQAKAAEAGAVEILSLLLLANPSDMPDKK